MKTMNMMNINNQYYLINLLLNINIKNIVNKNVVKNNINNINKYQYIIFSSFP